MTAVAEEKISLKVLSRFFNKDLELLEPYAMKVARTVLRGGSGSDAADLPDIIFGQPASKELLITLLNESLSGEHHIEDLTFLDKEDHSENASDKGIIYDLYCRTSTGEYIIVEMQNRWHSNFVDRTLYYVCRAISRLVEKLSAAKVPVPDVTEEESGCFLRKPIVPYGTQYKLPTVYGIFLINFKEDKLEPKFRTDTVIAEYYGRNTPLASGLEQIKDHFASGLKHLSIFVPVNQLYNQLCLKETL